MKIPIRIKEYALKKENSSFDLLGGIINFINNIKLIFTNKLIDVIPYQFPIEIDEFRGLFYNKYGAILLSLSH